MKIIELGRCIDNVDPMGMGRIRVEFLEVLNSPKEKLSNFTPWDSDDPFMFYPFLPAHLNVNPQKNQLVKLIYWDTDNQIHSREYISGPFVNAYDFDGQGADKQMQATSRGVRIKRTKDLINPVNGQYNNPKTKGVVAQPEDMAFYGNYGTDILFTRNGVNIRAGKLDDDQLRKTGVPVTYGKPARISAKKYDSTIEIQKKEVEKEVPQHKALSCLVEYDVVDLGSDGVHSGWLKLYKIVSPVQGVTDTFNFNQDSTVAPTNKHLIREWVFNGVTLDEMARDMSTVLRKIDEAVDLKKINPLSTAVPVHPFYYRPTQRFFESLSGATEKHNAQILFNNINFGNSRPFDLSYSMELKEVPVKKEKVTVNYEVVKDKSTTIGTTLMDLVLLLSYEANIPNDAEKINFANLNNYELTQEEILREILPKTFSQVRGEPLLFLITLIVKYLVTHVHNPGESALAPPGLHEQLLEELQQATEKILNQKVRTN